VADDEDDDVNEPNEGRACNFRGDVLFSIEEEMLEWNGGDDGA
jgi:hypothetical protein